MVTTKDLKYLIAIADHGHFGKAAEACFVSQPALSMQIKKLEENLGVTLIERSNKSVLLTSHGAEIVSRARQVLSQIDEIKEIAKLAKDPFSGDIKIGIIPTLAAYLLPLIIPPLAKAYPKLSFYLIEEQTTSLLEKLKQGELDAAILSLPITEKNITQHILFQEEFYLATSATHPLAKLTAVKPQDLTDKNLLLLEQGHCMRDQALAVCHKMKVYETQNFRATSLETLRHMVMAGAGITLMPSLACTPHTAICYIPFHLSKPTRTIGIYWRTHSTKQRLLNALTVKIKTILCKLQTIKMLA